MFQSIGADIVAKIICDTMRSSVEINDVGPRRHFARTPVQFGLCTYLARAKKSMYCHV
jgi:hypothetical protein